MPNRILKESIRMNARIDRLSWYQEVFFYRLIVSVDDYGCIDARPVVLRSLLFPTRADIGLADVEEAVRTLEEGGLIRLYEVKDQPYLFLTGWNEHQNVRRKRHRYPAPPEAQPVENPRTDGGEAPDGVQPENVSLSVSISENENISLSHTDARAGADGRGAAKALMDRLRAGYPSLRSPDCLDLAPYLEAGMESDVIIDAAAEGFRRGGRSWLYVKSILDSRMEQGVLTLERIRRSNVPEALDYIQRPYIPGELEAVLADPEEELRRIRS